MKKMLFILMLLCPFIQGFAGKVARSEGEWVVDELGKLTAFQYRFLQRELKHHADTTELDLAVAILEGKQALDTSVFTHWRVGSGQRMAVIVVIYLVEERPGHAEATILWNSNAQDLMDTGLVDRIIVEWMQPSLEERKYGQALKNSAEAIFKLVRGESPFEPDTEGANIPYWIILAMVPLLIGYYIFGRPAEITLGDPVPPTEEDPEADDSGFGGGFAGERFRGHGAERSWQPPEDSK